MTQHTRGNSNIVSISEASNKIAESAKALNQGCSQQPVTVRAESVTARFYLNRPLWRFVTGMCTFELRDHLRALGVNPDGWYLSEDQSIVVMVDYKEFPYVKESLMNLLPRLHRTSLEQQALIEAAAQSTLLSGAP